MIKNNIRNNISLKEYMPAPHLFGITAFIILSGFVADKS